MFNRDLSGKRFGKLLVVMQLHPDRPRSKWCCICDCGNEIAVRHADLTSESVKSCGCIPIGRPKGHGLIDSRVYRIWKQMKQRCGNPNDQAYQNYGGRGIKCCERWEKFENFYADMGEPPEDMTLDRIDVNKNYGPDNCKWATWTEQHRNRRNNNNQTAFGKTQCWAAWAEEYKIPVNTLKNRMYRGKRKMTLEEALTVSHYAHQRKGGA